MWIHWNEDWRATSASLNTFYCTKHYLNSIYFISCVLCIILRTLVSAKIVRMMLYTLFVARAVACERDFHRVTCEIKNHRISSLPENKKIDRNECSRLATIVVSTKNRDRFFFTCATNNSCTRIYNIFIFIYIFLVILFAAYPLVTIVHRCVEKT